MKGNPFQEATQLLDQPREIVYSNTELQRIGAIAEAISKLQDYKHIFALSDFTPNQIILIAKAQVISGFWEVPEIDRLLENLAILQLSKNRKSRDEILKAIIGMTSKKNLKDRVKDVFTGGGNNEQQ